MKTIYKGDSDDEDVYCIFLITAILFIKDRHIVYFRAVNEQVWFKPVHLYLKNQQRSVPTRETSKKRDPAGWGVNTFFL